MKKYIYITIISIFTSIVLTSCNKKNKEYLLGEWSLITKPISDLEYKWAFKEDKVYIISTDGIENEAKTGDLDTCSFGPYVMKNGVISIALVEAPCNQMVYTGDWDVQSISESYLSIRRQTKNGSQWYDFEKVVSE